MRGGFTESEELFLAAGDTGQQMGPVWTLVSSTVNQAGTNLMIFHENHL